MPYTRDCNEVSPNAESQVAPVFSWILRFSFCRYGQRQYPTVDRSGDNVDREKNRLTFSNPHTRTLPLYNNNSTATNLTNNYRIRVT